jgi:hypothetical protein
MAATSTVRTSGNETTPRDSREKQRVEKLNAAMTGPCAKSGKRSSLYAHHRRHRGIDAEAGPAVGQLRNFADAICRLAGTRSTATLVPS